MASSIPCQHGVIKQSMILTELHGPEEVVVQDNGTTGKVTKSSWGLITQKLKHEAWLDLGGSRSLMQEGEDGCRGNKSGMGITNLVQN